MPLSAAPGPLPPPDQAWSAVVDFVGRCRAWAVDEITRRQASGRPTEAWESYLRFTDHTLHELAEGTLDRWFEGPSAGAAPISPPDPADRG